jgi:hypothetical protein
MLLVISARFYSHVYRNNSHFYLSILFLKHNKLDRALFSSSPVFDLSSKNNETEGYSKLALNSKASFEYDEAVKKDKKKGASFSPIAVNFIIIFLLINFHIRGLTLYYYNFYIVIYVIFINIKSFLALLQFF